MKTKIEWKNILFRLSICVWYGEERMIDFEIFIIEYFPPSAPTHSGTWNAK